MLVEAGSVGGDAVVIVTWGVGERLRDDDRYATYQAVLDRMNAALADVIGALGFEARPFGRAGATLVTGRRPSETASTELDEDAGDQVGADVLP